MPTHPFAPIAGKPAMRDEQLEPIAQNPEAFDEHVDENPIVFPQDSPPSFNLPVFPHQYDSDIHYFPSGEQDQQGTPHSHDFQEYGQQSQFMGSRINTMTETQDFFDPSQVTDFDHFHITPEVYPQTDDRYFNSFRETARPMNSYTPGNLYGLNYPQPYGRFNNPEYYSQGSQAYRNNFYQRFSNPQNFPQSFNAPWSPEPGMRTPYIDDYSRYPGNFQRPLPSQQNYPGRIMPVNNYGSHYDLPWNPNNYRTQQPVW